MDIKELDSIDKIIPVIEDIITNYCIDKDIDIKNIIPNQFNDIIFEIYLNVFKDNPILKVPNTYNTYDINVINDIYTYIYKRLCNRYKLPMNINTFCILIGINRDTIYEWLNTGHSDIGKRIMSDKEDSLEGLLLDKSLNPMKVLPILNHRFGWNEGTGHVTISHQKSQNVAQLPNFEPPKLSDNNGQNNGLPG